MTDAETSQAPPPGLWVSLALLLAASLVLGVTIGVIWWLVSPSPELVVRDDGIYPEDFANAPWFAADGWFLALGAIGGLLLTALAWRWCRTRPMTALGALVAGGTLLALSAWWLGGLLGPVDPTVANLEVGDTVSEPLGLRAVGVLFAPATFAVAGFVVLAAALPAAAEGVESTKTAPVVPQP